MSPPPPPPPPTGGGAAAPAVAAAKVTDAAEALARARKALGKLEAKGDRANPASLDKAREAAARAEKHFDRSAARGRREAYGAFYADHRRHRVWYELMVFAPRAVVKDFGDVNLFHHEVRPLRGPLLNGSLCEVRPCAGARGAVRMGSAHAGYGEAATGGKGIETHSKNAPTAPPQKGPCHSGRAI